MSLSYIPADAALISSRAMTKAKLSVQKSAIEGYGVFTLEPIAKGKFIAELLGSKVTYHTNVHGQSNRYPNWFGIGKNQWIDPVDEFQYLNHSCNPNAGLKGTRKLKMYALRDIAANEELTIDYAITEEDPDYGFENAESMHPRHRKFIGSIHTLPRDVYESYLPYIPDYFKKVYEKCYYPKVDEKGQIQDKRILSDRVIGTGDSAPAVLPHVHS